MRLDFFLARLRSGLLSHLAVTSSTSLLLWLTSLAVEGLGTEMDDSGVRRSSYWKRAEGSGSTLRGRRRLLGTLAACGTGSLGGLASAESS